MTDNNDPKATSPQDQSRSSNQPARAESQIQARRKLLKTLLAGGGVVSTAQVLPENWVRPVINTVALPAHAQTSFFQVRGLILDSGASIQSGTRSFAQSISDFLIQPAQAGIPFFLCCITITFKGDPSDNDTEVEIEIDCDAQPGADGSGTVKKLKNDGISVNGSTVTASTVSTNLVIGEIDGEGFTAKPGECTPLDGEEEEEEEEEEECCIDR